MKSNFTINDSTVNIVRPKSDLYVGLAALKLHQPEIQLSDSITITETYAHFFAPFLLAFQKPTEGQTSPAPWKAVTGGYSFDITAQLHIPETTQSKYGPVDDLLRTILFLVRLWVNPATMATIISSHPISELPLTPDDQLQLLPFELDPPYFRLASENDTLDVEDANWLRSYWKPTLNFLRKSPEFSLAVHALDGGQYQPDPNMALVSLWAAIEALFSPSPGEIRFRTAAFIAAFLAPPGDTRLELQRHIMKLYNSRSNAAHGRPKHNTTHLLDTFNLLRDILLRIIRTSTLPTQHLLEELLFTTHNSHPDQ